MRTGVREANGHDTLRQDLEALLVPGKHQMRLPFGQVETRDDTLPLANECPGLELWKRAHRLEHRLVRPGGQVSRELEAPRCRRLRRFSA